MSKKKIKEIFIGSNNKGKLKEIADLLPKSLKLYSNLDYKISSPMETGTSFYENSLLKAKYFSKKTKKICMSDDSGIEIDILDKKPGVYSADWAGKKRNFDYLKFLLHLEKEQLQSNINSRVNRMIKDGLIEEAKNLSDYKNLNALKTVGYKELYEYFNGSLDINRAIEKIKTNTTKYSKRQMTWFKKDSDYEWVENSSHSKSVHIISNRIKDYING